MKPYADTNFFANLYLTTPVASVAREMAADHRPILPVTWLLRVELINAFEQAVFFGFGENRARISPELAAACHGFFTDDLREGVAVRTTELSMPELTRRFEEIALRQTARHGFRTYDILHVASALTLGCDTFWSFDKRAAKLAQLEGLRTI